jgi:MFS family permease
MLGYILITGKYGRIRLLAYGYSFYLFLTYCGLHGQTCTEHSQVRRLFTIPGVSTLADLLVAVVERLLIAVDDSPNGKFASRVAGMLAGLAVFGIIYTTDPFWALVWISIALSGVSAAAPVASSIVSLISPRGGTATIGGWVNLVNNLMGVAAPIITGFIVGITHSFAGAFLVAGIVLRSASSLMVVLGPIEPIPGPDPVN